MNRHLLCLALVTSTVTLAAQELKVDLGGTTGRRESVARGWSEWAFNPTSPATNFGSVKAALRLADAGSGRLDAFFQKNGIDTGAVVGCDGVSAGPLELVLSGLSGGSYTIATFHNEPRENQPPAKLNIFVNGTLIVSNLSPTVGATNDYDLASAYLPFKAETGKDVVIKFVPVDPPAGVVLNGFELQLGNPAKRAAKPAPANLNEHVSADGGTMKLSWSAPASAVSHDVYFGTSGKAVAAADRKSGPTFIGNQKSSGWVTPKLSPAETYYWRVDEVAADGTITKGETWSFRSSQTAFPTAEGYGRFARGGRGGQVLKVTNLNDSGPGSLRAAVEAEGPRTVVFDVSGLITLESRLIIRNPYLTVAGQTAPGKGICLRKYNFGVGGTHDIIVRYMRVRPGNLSGQTLDGMGMAASDHCIVDHCSISWTLDESFSSRGAKNITLQRTLIAEALNEAGHKKYPVGTQHGYAASIGGNVGSFHHNLLAHCSGRNWSLAGGLDNSGRYAGRLDLRNNVVYNWKNRATDGGAHEVNFVANYYKPGPATTLFDALKAQYGGFPGSQRYYFADNVMPGHFGLTNQAEGRTATTERGGKVPTEYSPWSDTPFFESYVKTHTADAALTNVLADVGCNFPAFDEHDQRIIAEVRAGTFKYKGSKTGLPGLPDAQEDVGGWDDYPEVRRPAGWDTDNDGMPDDWEKSHGLNPKDSADGSKDLNGDGYTNLEKYLNSLVGEYSLTKR